MYELGLSGKPIYNVNNNCSSGASALLMARQLVAGGEDCVMALGFEKMERGSLGAKYMDRVNPLDKHIMAMVEEYEFTPSPPAAQMFGNAGREHMKAHGTKAETFGKIAEKNHRNSSKNPYGLLLFVLTCFLLLSMQKLTSDV